MYCCWWCTLDIKGDHIELPYKYENNKFKTMGKFCSWECVKSYNMKENRIKFGEIQSFITLYRKRKYGKILPLKCAPSRYVLKKFGGDISEEDYRSHFSEEPPVVSMPNTENFIHKVIIRKEKAKVQTEASKKQKIDVINGTTMKSETLNLRRSAPVKLKSNNLMDSLGLIAKKV